MKIRKLVIEGATYTLAGLLTVTIVLTLSGVALWADANRSTLGVITAWLLAIALLFVIQKALLVWWKKRKPNSLDS